MKNLELYLLGKKIGWICKNGCDWEVWFSFEVANLMVHWSSTREDVVLWAKNKGLKVKEGK